MRNSIDVVRSLKVGLIAWRRQAAFNERLVERGGINFTGNQVEVRAQAVVAVNNPAGFIKHD